MKTTLVLTALFFASLHSFATSVTLTNFKGVYNDQKQVDLSWLTMMEANVDHYEIQRSGDGMNFDVIDSLSSKMKITTNVYQLQYTYTDVLPLNGISYYRIKIVGRDGSNTLSPVVQMNNGNIEGARIYPTLIQNNTVFVESDKNIPEAKLEIFDLNGHKISETYWGSLSGRQNAEVSKSGYIHSGTYVARLTAKGQSIKNQLVMITSH